MLVYNKQFIIQYAWYEHKSNTYLNSHLRPTYIIVIDYFQK